MEEGNSENGQKSIYLHEILSCQLMFFNIEYYFLWYGLLCLCFQMLISFYFFNLRNLTVIHKAFLNL